jgi:pimeloyl-ACP methyl ester carboxylesterase
MMASYITTAGLLISEHDIRLRAGRVRYLRAGSGPPVVLVHGLLAHSFSWRFVIPHLAPHFTVYAPDLLGAGYSDRVPGLDCALPASAERILEFCDALGLGAFDLVGTSHGGALATMVAATAPHRIRRLVLVAPVNPWSRHGRRLTRVLATPLAAAAFRAASPWLLKLTYFWLARMFGDPRRIPPDSVAGYVAPLRRPGSIAYGLSIVRCWRADLRLLEGVYSRLAGIPTLLMWGDSDAAVLPDSAARVQQAIPGSELVIFPGIGHLPYEECPADFNRALLAFLQRS